MKKNIFILGIAVFIIFSSCEKEYSLENSGQPSELIVGLDCRISKITYIDTAGLGSGLGTLTADIDGSDVVTKITKYDSVSNVIEYIATPLYASDTVFIDADEYFLTDATKRITRLHALLDPADPLSPQYDVDYLYSSAGYLVSKSSALTTDPLNPFYLVNYTYSGNNLTNMTATNLSTGFLEIDADIDYYNNIIPKRYIYLFPDEKVYPYFNQFYNFGLKSYNAVKTLKVRNYDPGNIVRDSTVSTFSNYIMSRDTYILSVQMNGDDQQSIPAVKGKLKFSYKCK